MNKHITTALTLIAISVPVFAGAQTAGAAPVKAAPVANKGLPEKVIKERVTNVINALVRHQELLQVAINKVTEQSLKFKEKGGDVSKADVDITAARAKLDEVKKDIADLQNTLKVKSLADKANTQGIRDGVAKTATDLRACRALIVDAISKLKAVTVKRPATPTPSPVVVPQQ